MNNDRELTHYIIMSFGNGGGVNANKLPFEKPNASSILIFSSNDDARDECGDLPDLSIDFFAISLDRFPFSKYVFR